MTFVSNLGLALCIDVDRDAPFPIQGQIHAVSHFLLKKPGNLTKLITDPQKSMITRATIKGFESVINLVKSMDIPLNIFIEGRLAEYLPIEAPELVKELSLHQNEWDWGVHGFDHEDFPGLETGLSLTKDQQRGILRKARQAVQSLVGSHPIGFRAPYTRLKEDTLTIVEEEGFTYDSSLYIDTFAAPKPYKILEKLWEVPIVRVPENEGKRYYFYLWTLFEHTRPLQEHIQVASQLLKKKRDPGLLTINFHPWHLGYNIKERRYLSQQEFTLNLGLLEKYLTRLQEIQEKEIKFCKISDRVH